MSEVRKTTGLQTIFSFFLGLMVTAFIGVGVYTFHPPRTDDLEREIRELREQESDLRAGRPPSTWTEEEHARDRALKEERRAKQEALRTAREDWGRTTSIILITLATLTMVVSLLRAEQLPVISNGLLLGGVFTMVYGVGWIVATDRSVTRFVVLTVALAITLGLGYVRFARRRSSPVPPTHAMPIGATGAGELERRVRALEERLRDAASALSRDVDSRRTE